ncbi:DNA repair protein RecO [Catenovulum sediminis]|uniref:DNA repair protein RecO n=1 Tax=Catenovulum sediminis TaxID=1740262 RepID=UPI00117F5532|nr:DNA repair protein RecO [Catenovulum sediminis]
MQQAVLLHSRPYRENSFICDLLTEEDGRISIFYRKSKNAEPLTLFNVYWISLAGGQNELYFIRQLELKERFDNLTAEVLYSALYINEITCKLLAKVATTQAIFPAYIECLSTLSCTPSSLQTALRNYELEVLSELGVIPDFAADVESQQSLRDDQLYYFDHTAGWFRQAKLGAPAVLGKHIKQIALRDFSDPQCLRSTKVLMRWWIEQLVGKNRIKSRDLFKRK